MVNYTWTCLSTVTICATLNLTRDCGNLSEYWGILKNLFIRFTSICWIKKELKLLSLMPKAIRYASVFDSKLYTVCTVKLLLRDRYPERPPVLKDHIFLADGPICPYNWTCHQRLPVLRDHILMTNGMVFQDRFHCTICIWYTDFRPSSPSYFGRQISKLALGISFKPWPFGTSSILFLSRQW